MWLDQLNMMKKNSSLTIEEIAEKSGVPLGTLFKIFSGQTKDPKLGTIRSIVYCLGYTLDDLFPDTKNKNAPLYTSEAMKMAKSYDALDHWGRRAVDAVVREELARCESAAQQEESLEEEKVIALRFATQPVSAGVGISLDEEEMEHWTVQLNDLTRKADFAIGVEGDSMEPKYYDGDIILVRRQPAIEEGEIGIYIFDGQSYVKQQGHNNLRSLNTKYQDILPTPYADIECKGLVLGKLSPEWIKSC